MRVVTVLLVCISILLAGCVPEAPATLTEAKRSAGTRGLPPESTATPSATPPPTFAPTATLAADFTAVQAAALREEFQSDAQILNDRTHYSIDARVEFDTVEQTATIVGAQRVRYHNRGENRILELPLMLWPNDEQYRGGLEVGPALIDGHHVPGQRELDGLAVVYDLPVALVPGDHVDLSVTFTARAEGPIGGATPHRYGITEGVLFAPTFYPLVPRRVNGDWELRDAPPGGDTTNSDVASYSVRLNVPGDLRLVASGVELDRSEQDSRLSATFVGGPIRDFAFALGPFEMDERVVDDVAVRGWYLEEHADDAERMLDAAAFQLELLSDRIGPYPYTELDLVDVPGAYGGIEYPALVTIGTLGTPWLIEPVVHEVAHQWFYGLIGDDQIDQPWMDEAFATYATALYWEFSQDEGRATGYLSDLRAVVRDHPASERPIGLGVGEYQGGEYSVLVYMKGALFYQELRQRLGDETFFNFLQGFYQEHRYGFATANDFHSGAEMACSCELDKLFETWVFEGGDWQARGTQD